MTKPVFSIITVTLNNMEGLTKTTASIEQQTNQNYEWIIIDGASTDGTLGFLDNNNIPYLSEKDAGIYDAMNKGIKRATGQYIIFLNAGDTFENNNTLLEVFERVKEQEYDFIYGDSVENNGKQLLPKRSRPHTYITHGMFTHHQAMFYNKKTIPHYDTSYKIAADYDLTWGTLNIAKNILYLPFPLCVFEQGGLSQKQVLLGRKEQYKIRKKYGVSAIKNIFIFTVQSLAYLLRRLCPPIYWLLKRR